MAGKVAWAVAAYGWGKSGLLRRPETDDVI